MLYMVPMAIVEILLSPVCSINIIKIFLKTKLVSTIKNETKFAMAPQPITASVSFANF